MCLLDRGRLASVKNTFLWITEPASETADSAPHAQAKNAWLCLMTWEPPTPRSD